jgi:hypothetical protein
MALSCVGFVSLPTPVCDTLTWPTGRSLAVAVSLGLSVSFVRCERLPKKGSDLLT